MKTLLLLAILSACSAGRFYQGPEISEELKKNEVNLAIVVVAVESDFQQKSNFTHDFLKNGKDPFIRDDLDKKLRELESLKSSLINKTTSLLRVNGQLLRQIENKERITERDPVFQNLQNFSDNKSKALSSLLKAFEAYQKSSEEFEKLALYTKLVHI